MEGAIISGFTMPSEDVSENRFAHDLTLRTFCFVAHDIAAFAKLDFLKRNASVPEIRIREGVVSHHTLRDGSERDLFQHLYANPGKDVVLVEVEHHYITPFLLWLWVWWPEREIKHEYPVDDLFHRGVIEENAEESRKSAELFVGPCEVRIRMGTSDPFSFLPPKDILDGLSGASAQTPLCRFWTAFTGDKFEDAIAALGELPATSAGRESADWFVQALRALCELRNQNYDEAWKSFLKCAQVLDTLGRFRLSDLCLYHAVEAASTINDLNDRVAALAQVADNIPGIEASTKKELRSILASYATGVYIGVAVLCRRLTELVISVALREDAGSRIMPGSQTAVLKTKTGPGLHRLLVLAKEKGILSEQEFDVARHIKSFGNRIHDPGTVENRIDAKYSLQACIHIVRRISQRSIGVAPSAGG